jgi:two-component system OmpR family response regulator
MPGPKLLLIIDESPIEEGFLNYFKQFGFKIIQKNELNPNLDNLETLTALLINWSLIKADSTRLDTLYQQHCIPIIIISNTNNEEICVRMLEAGADDFMIKPINPRELHARIGAITRRVHRMNQHPEKHTKEVILFANWRLYPTSRQLFNGPNELSLSTKEYDLLLAFTRQPQQILDREFLAEITQSSSRDPLDRRIDVQICRLRQKIELDPNKPVLIKAIRNKGYMLTASVRTTKE